MSPDRTHAIVSTLIRTLTHNIRSPLAVISNELAALTTLHPGSELELSRQRVTQISELLKNLSLFATSSLNNQKFDGNDVLRDVVTEYSSKCIVHNYNSELPVVGDRRLFELALRSIMDLLLQLGSEPVTLKCGQDRDTQQGRIIFSSSYLFVSENLACGPWSSCRDFFNDGIGLDSFLPACIDSILLAQSVTVSIAASSNIEITLHFSTSQ